MTRTLTYRMISLLAGCFAISGCASIGKQFGVGLSPLERELRDWLANHNGHTRIKLGLRVKAPVQGLPGLVVNPIRIITEVSSTGEILYSGRSLSGMRYKVEPRELTASIGKGREVAFIGFTLGEGEGLFTVKQAVADETTGHAALPPVASIRVPLAKDYVFRSNAWEIIKELGKVVDFGDSYDVLHRNALEYQQLQGQVQAIMANLKVGSTGLIEQVEYNGTLRKLLEAAIANRETYARLLGTNHNHTVGLRKTLQAVNTDLEMLEPRVKGELVGRLSAKLRELSQDLVAADRGLREVGMGAHRVIGRAQELRTLLLNMTKSCEELRELTQNRLQLEDLKAFMAELDNRISTSERALRAGCARLEPLTTDELLELVRIPAPDAAIAVEVRRCGVDFEPGKAVEIRLRTAGMGDETLLALGAIPEPRRPSWRTLRRMPAEAIDNCLAAAVQ